MAACWSCKFGKHFHRPHTWEEGEDSRNREKMVPDKKEGTPCFCDCAKEER